MLRAVASRAADDPATPRPRRKPASSRSSRAQRSPRRQSRPRRRTRRSLPMPRRQRLRHRIRSRRAGKSEPAAAATAAAADAGTSVDPSQAPLAPVTTYPDASGAQQQDQTSPNAEPQTTTTVPGAPKPKPQAEPVGAATAESVPTAGGAAAKPAGIAIAPAKQHQTRSLLFKIGAVVAAGAALGTVYALSHSTSSIPPGTGVSRGYGKILCFVTARKLDNSTTDMDGPNPMTHSAPSTFSTPLLISFSGVDGSGRSTQIESLRSALHAAGLKTTLLAFWDNVSSA